jgi:hypothetical protein
MEPARLTVRTFNVAVARGLFGDVGGHERELIPAA